MTDLNPYAPPSANVHDYGSVRRFQAFWKVFFWVDLAVLGLACIQLVLIPRDRVAFYDLFDLIFSGITLLAIYGLGYSTAIFRRDFWKYCFWLYLPRQIAVTWLIPFVLNQPMYGEVQLFDGKYIAGTGFVAIATIGIYLYAFRANHIWTSEAESGA